MEDEIIETYDSHEAPLHPAFFVVSGEVPGSVVLSSDKTSVLACSQPVQKVGEGSAKQAAELLNFLTHARFGVLKILKN